MSSVRISTIALLSAILLSSPAMALSINLGGNGSGGNGGNGGNSGANVNVGGGGNGGGNGGGVKANVDLDDLTNGNDGNNNPVSVSIGGGNNRTPATVNLNGSPTTSPKTNLNVNTGKLLPSATGGLIDDGTTDADVTLGGSNSNLVNDLLNGSGTGGTTGTANVKIGNTIPLGNTLGTGTTGGASTAKVAIGTSPLGSNGDLLGGLNTANVGNVNADADLLQSLFGGAPGTGDDGGTSGIAGGDFGDGNGDGTGDGTSTAGNDGTTTGGAGTATTGTQVASLDANIGKSCVAPNGTQTRTLLSRHPYNDQDLSYFGTSKNLQVVSIGLCSSSRSAIEAAVSSNSGVSGLQTFFGRSPTLTGALAQSNHKPSDIIAADRKGDTLVVYVM